MKKLYILFALFALGLTYSSADAQKSSQMSGNTFKPGWFIGANGGINWYFAEGNDITDSRYLNSIHLGKDIGYQFGGVLGYNFNEISALRGTLGYNHYKQYIKGTNGDITKKVPNTKLNLDYVLNVTNLAKGYNPSRLFTFSLFAGLGGHYIPNNNQTSKIGGAIRGGLQGDFNISPQLALNVILDGNLLTDNFNDEVAEIPFDMAAGLSLGLAYRFEKKEKPDMKAEGMDEEEKLPMKEVDNTPQIAATDTAKKVVPVDTTPVKPVEVKQEPIAQAVPATKEEIFFKFNSREVSGASQEDGLKKVSDYLKANPTAKIIVSGYADNSSGTEDINQRVSEQRAQNVSNKLIKEYGVNPNRIMVKAYGSKVQPYKEIWKNRVVIVNTADSTSLKNFKGYDDGISSIVNESATRAEINFAASNAGIVNEKQKQALERIAKYLKENPSAKVSVSGYASNHSGTPEINDEISKKRAIIVANKLIKEYGIDYNRIKVSWFGGRVQPYKTPIMNQLVIVKAE